MLVFLVAGGLIWALGQASTWVTAHPNETTSLMNRYYPRDRQNPLMDRPSQDALAGLRYSLRTSSPWTRNTLLWLPLTGGLLAVWYRLRRLRLLWQGALVLLVTADLLLFARDFHPRLARQDLAPRSRVVEFLAQNNGIHRVYVAWPVTLVGPNRLMPYQIADAGGYSSLVTQRYNDYVGAMQRQPGSFLDMVNVRYIVALPQSGQDQLTNSTKVFEEGSYAVYERRNPLPRAYIVHDARAATSGKDALRLISDNTFDPRRTVVLENMPAGSEQSVGAPADSDAATVLSYASEDMSVQTETAKGGYLVLSDTYYPGWQAEVDGKKVPIVRANYLFRSVQVPAGQHIVRFYFQSQSVALGGLISLLAGLGIVLAAGLTGLQLFVRHSKE